MLNLTTAINKKHCPYLYNPFDDCYCAKMSSQDIERAIYLCSNNFAMCEIYKSKNGNGNGNGKDKHNHKVVKQFDAVRK